MMARCLMLSMLLSVPLQGLEAGSISTPPRLAAVAFAIKNGFDMPRSNLVVATETTLGQVPCRAGRVVARRRRSRGAGDCEADRPGR